MKRFFNSVAAAVVISASVLSIFASVPAKAQTIDNDPDCDTVAVIKCGAFSESELRADYAKNTYGDLGKVYGAFGISKSELSGFTNGIVWKDGRVTVDGKTVATGAITAGRWNNPKSGMTYISGTERAYKMPTKYFVTDGQTAFVKMVNGKFSFAVIKSCGNPVTAKAVSPPKPPAPKPVPKPTFDCVSLSAKAIDVKTRKFGYTVNYKVTNGAALSKADFNFGDGTTQNGVTPANLNKVTHMYAKAGAYTTKVNLTFVANGKVVGSDSCTVKITAVPDACPIKPSVPKDDPSCKPCPTKPELPADDPACKEQPPVTPPAELPNTGAGSMVGLFTAVTLAGAAGHKLWMIRRFNR